MLSNFESIQEKALALKRLSKEEALSLLSETDDDAIEKIAHLADQVRQKRVGDQIFLDRTLYLYPTNLCTLKCPLCSFYAVDGSQKAFRAKVDDLIEKLHLFLPRKITHVHIVSGLWPTIDLNYYLELFSKIKTCQSSLHIKALTAVEIDYLATLHSLSIGEVLTRLKNAGLDSLAGGGAEILVDSLRAKIAPKKLSSSAFLKIHSKAHKLHIPSNVTMLFGHIESMQEIVEHLLALRFLQDETKGFHSFIPLRFGRENNALGKLKNLKEKNSTLIYAASRLILDNFDHIKVLWHYLGFEMGLKMIKAGASEFASENLEEQVIAQAGGDKRKIDQATIACELEKIGRKVCV